MVRLRKLMPTPPSQYRAWRLRRALYRLWLYSSAFHNPSFDRGSRTQPPIIRTRAALLRYWSTEELAEMLDVQSILRALLAFHVCPSNGTVLRRHKKRYPYEPAPVIATMQLRPGSMAALPKAKLGTIASEVEGWGDDINHYYMVEDMLKLNPGQIVWLYCHAVGEPTKYPDFAGDRIIHNLGLPGAETAGACGCRPLVHGLIARMGGEWFNNNGQTFEETMASVVRERGCDMEEIRQAVEEGEVGVVKGAFW